MIKGSTPLIVLVRGIAKGLGTGMGMQQQKSNLPVAPFNLELRQYAGVRHILGVTCYHRRPNRGPNSQNE